MVSLLSKQYPTPPRFQEQSASPQAGVTNSPGMGECSSLTQASSRSGGPPPIRLRAPLLYPAGAPTSAPGAVDAGAPPERSVAHHHGSRPPERFLFPLPGMSESPGIPVARIGAGCTTRLSIDCLCHSPDSILCCLLCLHPRAGTGARKELQSCDSRSPFVWEHIARCQPTHRSEE